MIHNEVYEKNDQKWFDKDPDNKHTYVIDITAELQKNALNAVSVSVPIAYRMTVTKGPTLEVEGENTYVKVQVIGPTPASDLQPGDAHITARVVCDGDGDDFDATTYFNAVER